jgi:hypothetical protein
MTSLMVGILRKILSGDAVSPSLGVVGLAYDGCSNRVKVVSHVVDNLLA